MNGKQRMVERSKQWLYDVLIDLVTKENFQDISVTEIAQAAELSRKTLCHSFKSKEVVINYLCDQLLDQYFEQLLQQRPQVGEVVLKTIFGIFLNLWWQKRDLVQLLIRQGLFDHMSEVWQQKTIPRYQRLAALRHVQGASIQVNYVMAFQLDGLTNILRVWLGQGNPGPPEQAKGVMLSAVRQLTDSLNAN